MKPGYKKMLVDVIKAAAIELVATALIIAIIVLVVSQLFHVKLQVSTAALVLGITGTANGVCWQ